MVFAKCWPKKVYYLNRAEALTRLINRPCFYLADVHCAQGTEALWIKTLGCRAYQVGSNPVFVTDTYHVGKMKEAVDQGASNPVGHGESF